MPLAHGKHYAVKIMMMKLISDSFSYPSSLFLQLSKFLKGKTSLLFLPISQDSSENYKKKNVCCLYCILHCRHKIKLITIYLLLITTIIILVLMPVPEILLFRQVPNHCLMSV